MTIVPHDDERAATGAPASDPHPDAPTAATSDDAYDDSDWLDHAVAFVRSRPYVWIPGALAVIVAVVLVAQAINPSQPIGTDPTIPGHPLSNQSQHVHSLAVDPLHPGIIYIGSHYGLFVSRDDGHTWPQPRGYLNTVMITSLATSPLQSGDLGLIGISPSGIDFGQNGVYFSRDYGQHWQLAHDPPGIPSSVYRYLIAPGLASPTDWLVVYSGYGLYETANDGQSWRLLRPQQPNDGEWTVWVSPADPKTIFVGSVLGLVVTHDDGATWRHISGISGGVSAIAASPANSSQIYLSAESGIYRSSDAGQTFTEVSSPVSTASFSRLAVSNQHPNVLYGLVGQQVWASTNGGVTWNQRASLSASNPMALLVAPNDDQHLYVGFYAPPAVITSLDGGQTWQILTSQ